MLTQALSYDEDGLARLDAVQQSGRVTTADTERGPIVVRDGRKLHSGRDPVREAARWARGLDLAEATVVIVLGYGSGYGVRALAERTDAAIVVFEPDLEVLAVGATHGPIPERAKLFTNAKQLGRFLGVRLGGIDRGVIATWTASARGAGTAYAEALHAAQDAVGRARLRHRTACLRGPAWLDHYLDNVAQLVASPALPQLAGCMRGVPAIIAAAGPSLDRNIEQLPALRDRALILTVNSAARALARAGVQPHALVSIESADVTAGLDGLPWLGEIAAFLELTGNPNLWSVPFARRIALSVDTNGCSAFSEQLAEGLGISGGFCVANAAVAVARILGCDPIILVGSDLAYAGTRVYARGTMFEEMRAEPSGDGTVKMSGLEGRRLIEQRSKHALGGNHTPTTAHTIEVGAWDGTGVVTTTRDFAMFRDWYTHFAQMHPEATLLNATEGGAWIDGWTHVPLRDAVPADSTPSVPVSQRFAAAVGCPAVGREPVAAAVAAELDRVNALRALVRQAIEIVGHDPDGDLSIDGPQADRLLELNDATRVLLRSSPLASEAAFVPVEELRGRGDVSTYSLYASLDGSLGELADKLAQLLQRLPTGENQDGYFATDQRRLTAG